MMRPIVAYFATGEIFMGKNRLLVGAVSAILGVTAITPGFTKEEGICEHCGQSLSDAFINVSKRCRPAVVHIEAEVGGREVVGYPFNGDNPFEQFQEELFQRFFGMPNHEGSKSQKGNKSKPQRPSQMSTGSGFFVSSDGYIVTNHHVVRDASKITVEMYDRGEKEYEAQLIGCDPQSDIAILKIACENTPYLEFADSDNIQVGQWTIAIGHPFKLRDSVTAGVISATHRGDLQISQLEDFIQTDASINPGNSGGCLLDLNGKVIGVNTAILSKGGGSVGLGFAVPSNIAKMVYDQIKQNGCVDRAFLGVQIQELTEELCEGFRLKKGTTGALIAEVVPDSAAELSGLKAGDIVTHFNGEAIKTGKQLYTAIGKLASGSKCKVEILREGKKEKIDLTLGSRVKDVSQEGDIIHKLGLKVEPLNSESAHKYGLKTDEKGVVITKVLPDTMAATLGWSAGSVIKVVNGIKVTSIQELKQALEKAKPGERIVILLHSKRGASFHSIPAITS